MKGYVQFFFLMFSCFICIDNVTPSCDLKWHCPYLQLIILHHSALCVQVDLVALHLFQYIELIIIRAKKKSNPMANINAH